MQGQPDNWGDEPGEDCGQVVGSNLGQWNDENCDVKRKYICQHINRESTKRKLFFVSCGKSAVSPFIFKSCFLLCSSANPGPQCDLANGWSPYGSNCYKLKADTMKSWLQARLDCVQEGGDLVSITSAAEEQYVTGILGTSQLDIWIGFSTLVRGISLSYLMFKISISCIGVKLGVDFFFPEMQQDFM